MRKSILFTFAVLAAFSCKKETEFIPLVNPEANFTYSVNPVFHQTVSFLNASKSIHKNSKYVWYFGDGDSSSLENPVHSYKFDGTYSVVLQVTNTPYIDCYSRTILISSQIPDSLAQTPNVSFTFSQNGLDVILQNTTSGADINALYEWNLGENTQYTSISTYGNYSHKYAKEGAYNVVLRVTYNNTIYSTNRTIYVSEKFQQISDTAMPIPAFSYYYNANGTLSFVNTSSFTSSSTKYNWYFRKGITSTDENPTDISFPNGVYSVVLKVSNGNYTMATSREIEVPKTNKPIALFVYSQDGLRVKFVNASSNINTNSTFEWVFGDGEVSTEESPTHLYTSVISAKKYNVVLKVTNGSVSDVYETEVTVQ